MAEKEFEPDDPMELTGMALPGDTQEAMAECFVEEFSMMGYGEDEILKMFQNPFYAAVHAVYREKGEPFVRDLISRVKSRWGTFRFRTELS